MAVAAVLALFAGGAVLLHDGGDRDVVADGGTTSTPSTAPSTAAAPASGVPFELLVEGSADVPVGTLTYAGIADSFSMQWGLSGFDGGPPEVDFEHSVVVSFTRMAACDGLLVDVTEDRGVYEPVFDDTTSREGCDGPLSPWTYVVSLARAGLPQRFTLALEPGAGLERELVEIDLESASIVQQAPSAPPSPPSGPDLAPPEPGREITFDSIGDFRLGQVLDPDSRGPIRVSPYEGGGSCGYWGPYEPSHDGDEPPSGLVDGARTGSPVIADIKVGPNPRYRTASGVGVGTTLRTLERIYGDDLVVDRADGWERPTDGLLASYQDVAAVRRGDRALTFYLWQDAVEMIKLSDAGSWGDDEGCA